jgi:uncharacterized phiE125 gp8 family phage protein
MSQFEYGLSTSDYASPQSPSSITTIVYGLPRKPNVSLTPYRSLVRTVRPTVEPVSLAQAKSHLRVDTDADNEYIITLIQAAREYVEELLDTTLVTTTWAASYDCFPLWEIVLPRPPLIASVSVAYRDVGGTSQTLTDPYQTDARAIPGRIFPIFNTVWPAVRGDENSVVVTYTAGYGDSGAAVPGVIKHAILLLVANWYAIREPVVVGSTANSIPNTLETLLSSAGFGVYR